VPTNELLWTGLSFLLTLLVFSYILGDNPVFRFVLALLVGVTAGTLAVILIRQVIFPNLTRLVSGENIILAAIPIILSLLLVLKLIPRFSRIGNIPMAFLVGAASAVIIGGAIMGTLVSQVGASVSQFPRWNKILQGDGVIGLLEGGLVLLGTITSLLYFQFTRRVGKNGSTEQPAWVNFIRSVGKFFIVVTLGAMFAGVLSASITALVQRLSFLWESIHLLIG
jgi:hypothetical protein